MQNELTCIRYYPHVTCNMHTTCMYQVNVTCLPTCMWLHACILVCAFNIHVTCILYPVGDLSECLCYITCTRLQHPVECFTDELLLLTVNSIICTYHISSNRCHPQIAATQLEALSEINGTLKQQPRLVNMAHTTCKLFISMVDSSTCKAQVFTFRLSSKSLLHD